MQNLLICLWEVSLSSLLLCPKSDEDAMKMVNVPYANAIGSLMYAMVCSRPDIAYLLSVFSKYMANPGKEHWKGVKWLLRYVKGSIDLGLKFGSSRKSVEVYGYVDPDFAGDQQHVICLWYVVVQLVGNHIFNPL